MEALIKEQQKVASSANLSKSVEDIQNTIDLLVKARESIAASKSCVMMLSTSKLNMDL